MAGDYFSIFAEALEVLSFLFGASFALFPDSEYILPLSHFSSPLSKLEVNEQLRSIILLFLSLPSPFFSVENATLSLQMGLVNGIILCDCYELNLFGTIKATISLNLWLVLSMQRKLHHRD